MMTDTKKKKSKKKAKKTSKAKKSSKAKAKKTEESSKKGNVQKALASIRKKYGDKSVLTADEVPTRERLSTGFAMLDKLTVGGFPKGQVTIIWGPEGAGKSTLAYTVAGSALASNEDSVVIIADIENSFDPGWAAAQGCGGERCLVLPVDARAFQTAASLEEVLDRVMGSIADLQADGVQVAMVIIDSIHGIAVSSEIATKAGKERSLKDDTVASLPRKVTQFIRIAGPRIAHSGCSFVVIGQARDKVDLYGGMTLTGGHALKHASRCTLRVSALKGAQKITTDEEGDILSWYVKVKAEKINAPTEGSSIELPFLKGVGFDELSANVDRGILLGHIIKKGGGYFEWRDGCQMRGRDTLDQYFRDNRGEYEILLGKLYQETPSDA